MENVINGLLRREKEHQDGIEACKTQSVALASRLAPGGQFETLLDPMTMQQFRESLKEIARDNVEKERQLQAYMDAVKSFGDGSNISEKDDIPAMLHKAVRNERAKIDKKAALPEEEETYKELCIQLGEKQTDEDDDFEMVNVDEISSLKCPITRTFMEDPVRNKKCGHVYSEAAIMINLRHTKECPVAGCSNRSVSVSQLEHDELTAIKVRRAKKREKLEQQTQSQNAVDLEDDDEDEL
jgi:SUMO ligase MMS21 Smc5/6 complex component